MSRYDPQKAKKYREKNHARIVAHKKKYYLKYKEKVDKKIKQYYEGHKEEALKYQKKYREENKQKIQVWMWKHFYNLSLEQVDGMLIAQDHKCKICGESLKKGKGRHVDHDHKTGKVRGILCHTCNTGLGSFKDDQKLLESAIQYLKETA